MNNLEGFTIASKIPQAKYEREDKRRFKATRGEVAYYTADKIKEYYKWVEEVSKIPQESINQTVSEMTYLISRGIPQDVHSGNMIYNPKTKKVTITDWFWDEKAIGRSVMTNAPTLTGIFERVCMIHWVRSMQMYFEQHGKKPVQKEAAEAFKAGIGKAMRQALEYFEKCLKAFEANNVSPSKTDHQDSFFSAYKFETETYADMIRRVLSDSFADYWYDFDEVQRADAVAISNPDEVPKEQIRLKVGETLEERAERDKRLAENKKEIEEEEERLAAEIAEQEAKFKQTELPKDNPKREKPTLEEFRKWVELVNMKNKELKAFHDSDWFAASGLTPAEAKAQGIKSGQDSFRAIIRMRKKLGLTGPKDYIKAGPQITKKYYEMALEKWTGPDNKVSALDDRSDWGWMKRQIRFNSRASAFPYNKAQEKRKGPLVKKQKTQNQPSRKLLSLWVWGHDPWRWARKNGVANMPECPDVPWVGMTEKRKYGKIPVIMGPRSNPGHYKDRRIRKEKLRQEFNPFAKDAATQANQMSLSDLRLDTDLPRYRLTNGRLYYPIMTRSPPLVVTTHAIYRYFERFRDTLTGDARRVADRMRSLPVTAGEIGPRNEETDRLFGEGLSILARAGYHINSNRAVVQESYYSGIKYNHIVSYYRGGRKNPSEELKNPPTIIGTGSPKKVAEYKALLGDGYTYDDQYDLPEVVGDPKTVIIHKAALAYKVWGKPVIVEDTTLHIEGMSLEDASNIKWMVDDLPDHVGKKAVERVSIGYADGVNVYAYVGRTDGKLVTRRGTKGFAHDFYFMPKGSTKTYAEEKKVSSRTKAIKKFVADKPDFAVDMPEDWTGAWQENYTPEDMLANPRIPKKYEGQDPSEHSDLYTDEDPKGTIQGLGFKDKATAEKSVNIIKRSGKTHAHKIQAAMAMEQRARFHPNATPGIKAAQKVYAKFIEEMKEKTKRNPKKTPEGRKIPTRYLKGLNREEMLIAAKEIDKGYKYDINDPKAYEYWKSDIKATARGYKTVPSKYKKKFIKMYGPLPEKGKFLDKMSKATGIKKSILQKVY